MLDERGTKMNHDRALIRLIGSRIDPFDGDHASPEDGNIVEPGRKKERKSGRGRRSRLFEDRWI